MKSRNKKPPTVSIIGVGRVGRTLAHALQSAGYRIVALVFHDSVSGRKSRKQFPEDAFPGAFLLGSVQLARLPPSDVILITTPDDAIAATAEQLAKAHPGEKRRAVMHTSGALSSEALAPLAAAGFSIASIHPLVAIDPADGDDALRGAFYCIEGQKAAVSSAKSIALDLGGTPIIIKPDKKALYHAGALLASPDLVALFDLAVELMVSSGVKWADARRMLLPLVESTVKNLNARPPASAITGTFARGDVGTVERHLKVLSDGKHKLPPDALAIYKLLGLRSLQLAKKNGLDRRKIAKIKQLLKD
ncbi:MAG TPA: Rossmann-like and DUF2520 domain-containing protein [Pyrinomonadaceae bacterium]|nr:Rossmann-like and DUF2520 domain-containing protein [Pyrinomonadaceae bacterium]